MRSALKMYIKYKFLKVKIGSVLSCTTEGPEAEEWRLIRQMKKWDQNQICDHLLSDRTDDVVEAAFEYQTTEGGKIFSTLCVASSEWDEAAAPSGGTISALYCRPLHPPPSTSAPDPSPISSPPPSLPPSRSLAGGHPSCSRPNGILLFPSVTS